MAKQHCLQKLSETVGSNNVNTKYKYKLEMWGRAQREAAGRGKSDWETI